MKTYKQYREQRIAANEKLGDLYLNAANRELTDEEKMQELNLTREIRQCEDAMRAINLDSENEKLNAQREQCHKADLFREILKDSRKGGLREILLDPTSPAAGNSITESGAINLSIKDIIPTLNEGLNLPVGLNVVSGVTGNELWPVIVDDVEIEELGEVESLTDQTLHFTNITPLVRRIGMTVPVSNRAIDNAAFDLMAFVQRKFTLAMRKHLAKKVYSQAEWTGVKGPFSGMTATSIELGTDAYKNILTAVAGFADKGFEGNVCLVMDNVTEAELKATPKAQGQGGFVIEGGKCAGYDYVVSHYLNTELDSAGALVPTADRYIGVGYWEWLAVQTHDEVRLTVDATSQAVAKKNITAVTLNLAMSITDLSTHVNGADNVSQAFGLFKIADAAPTTE